MRIIRFAKITVMKYTFRYFMINIKCCNYVIYIYIYFFFQNPKVKYDISIWTLMFCLEIQNLHFWKSRLVYLWCGLKLKCWNLKFFNVVRNCKLFKSLSTCPRFFCVTLAVWIWISRFKIYSRYMKVLKGK
jgi:hypothetical protein